MKYNTKKCTFSTSITKLMIFTHYKILFPFKHVQYSKDAKAKPMIFFLENSISTNIPQNWSEISGSFYLTYMKKKIGFQSGQFFQHCNWSPGTQTDIYVVMCKNWKESVKDNALELHFETYNGFKQYHSKASQFSNKWNYALQAMNGQ